MTTKADLARVLNDRAYVATTYIKSGVVVHVRDSHDGKAPAPAWYVPGTDDIFIDVDRAEVPQALLENWDLLDEKVKSRLLGLLAHEAAHSAWSHWLHPKLVKTRKAVFAVLTMLEEIRIENRAVAAAPHVAPLLRAALPLVIGGLKDKAITSRAQAARGWALIYGRTLSGIVHDDDVDWMDETARIVLGDDDVDTLVELLTEAVVLSSESTDRLVEIAEEWIEVVGTDDPGDDGEGGGGCSHGDPEDADESEPGDESGDDDDGEEAEPGDGGTPDPSGEPTDTDDDAGEDGTGAAGDEDDDEEESTDDSSTEAEAGDDRGGLGDLGSQESGTDSEGEASQPLDPEAAEAMWEAIKDAIGDVDEHWQPQRAGLDMADPATMAAKAFGGKTRKGRLTPVEPTIVERGEISKTARILESLALPSVTKKLVATITPPGRLRSREALRQSAERAQGMLSTAKPWRTAKRRHDSVRPVVVGVMTDVSGSMAWAEHVVAQFAYVWGNAGSRIGARTASVTFGDQVDAVVRPGEVPAKVMVKAADGGSEHFDEGAAALDGVLKLSHPDGAAKILIVVSDGHFVIGRETDRAYEWCKRFKDGGTTVVWIRPNRGSHALTDRLAHDGLATVVAIDGVSYYGRSDDSTVFGKVQAAALTALAKRS